MYAFSLPSPPFHACGATAAMPIGPALMCVETAANVRFVTEI
jgi:hypothetical protein